MASDDLVHLGQVDDDGLRSKRGHGELLDHGAVAHYGHLHRHLERAQPHCAVDAKLLRRKKEGEAIRIGAEVAEVHLLDDPHGDALRLVGRRKSLCRERKANERPQE